MAPPKLLIAGGGIAGLAASLAVAQTGWAVCLAERADAFAEIGAGIQIGPNVTRILHGWGLQAPLRQVAAYPDRLRVRDAASGATLGALRLGERALARYGAPYATIHRADLHTLLAERVQALPTVECRLGQTVTGFADDSGAVALHTESDGNRISLTGEALLGADGVRSPVRQQLLADGAPRFTGHIAYRAMLAQAALPATLRSHDVTLWLGPRLHVVHYPVRGGDWLNLVAIVEGDPAALPPADSPFDEWDHAAQRDALQRAIAHRGGCCAPLADLIAAAPHATVNPYAWRLWALAGRAPVQGPGDMARGRIALAGDAAHPTLPYLAQGACMAVEDAAELARCLTPTTTAKTASAPDAIPDQLARYARARWQRCARIQQRSTRNGHIFHATGALRLARDTAMRALGEPLMDLPWLYGYGM